MKKIQTKFTLKFKKFSMHSFNKKPFLKIVPLKEANDVINVVDLFSILMSLFKGFDQ